MTLPGFYPQKKTLAVPPKPDWAKADADQRTGALARASIAELTREQS
jgi:hypothetical protein